MKKIITLALILTSTLGYASGSVQGVLEPTAHTNNATKSMVDIHLQNDPNNTERLLVCEFQSSGDTIPIYIKTNGFTFTTKGYSNPASTTGFYAVLPSGTIQFVFRRTYSSVVPNPTWNIQNRDNNVSDKGMLAFNCMYY